jgi:hypothetical protein
MNPLRSRVRDNLDKTRIIAMLYRKILGLKTLIVISQLRPRYW